jgi:hypothetical protein
LALSRRLSLHPLVAYESLTGKQRAVDDARLVGVPAASIAVAGRLPLIAVVTLAALTTALARPF